MSYYMAKGSPVTAAAAGVGALPPQAAAGLGSNRLHAWRDGVFTRGMSGLPPQAAAGLGSNRLRAYADGVFSASCASCGPETNPYPLRAYTDGYLGGLGADERSTFTDPLLAEGILDLSNPAVMYQFKRVLSYIKFRQGAMEPTGGLSAASLDNPDWDNEAASLYKDWVRSIGGPPSAEGMMITSNGLPTVQGAVLLVITNEAEMIEAMGAQPAANFAGLHWPSVAIWAGNARQDESKASIKFSSSMKAGMSPTLWYVGGGVLAAGVLWAVFR